MAYKDLFFDLDHTLWDFELNAKETMQELYINHHIASLGITDFDAFFNIYAAHNHRLWDRYAKGFIKQEELRWKRIYLSLLDFKIANEQLSKEMSLEFLQILPTKKKLFPHTIEILNYLPSPSSDVPNLLPSQRLVDINHWLNLMQNDINDGVYRCGFARNQAAYNRAEAALFAGLAQLEEALLKQGPWLCGGELTMADVRLFPTLIRWEQVYAPLFRCSRSPLFSFPALWAWRARFCSLPGVLDTCYPAAWRRDYFGALFPLNPSLIVPAGPSSSEELFALIQATMKP